MEKVDELEAELQSYIDNFTKLAEALNTGKEAPNENIASQLVDSKNKMIGLVQGMDFLDKGEENLMKDVRAWEELNKQSIRRAQKVDKELEGVEKAINNALESLHNKQQ